MAAMWTLNDKEKEFLTKQGYLLEKTVFKDDICSEKPNTTGYYVCAVHTLARLLGYRDRYSKDFHKARLAFQKVYG